jgi:hypothetical protein
MKKRSHRPPGSKLLGLFVVTQKEDTQDKRQRSSKAGKFKRKVDKRKRGEEEDRRPGRYIEGFQSSELRKKRSKSPNLYIFFSLCSQI